MGFLQSLFREMPSRLELLIATTMNCDFMKVNESTQTSRMGFLHSLLHVILARLESLQSPAVDKRPVTFSWNAYQYLRKRIRGLLQNESQYLRKQW
jgi:hypothetical protein